MISQKVTGIKSLTSNYIYAKQWDLIKQESLLTKRLKIMILEVFKTVNRLNPSCLHDLFTKMKLFMIWEPRN